MSVLEDGDVPAIRGLFAVGNEHTTLVDEDRHDITPKQLVHLTPDRTVQLYDVFQEDTPGDLRQLQNEVGRCKARWETMNIVGRLHILDNTIQVINPDAYSNMYTAVVTLMVTSVSTATAERSFSSMRRLKNYLCSTMTTERMSGLVLMHVHKDTGLDAERIIHKSSHSPEERAHSPIIPSRMKARIVTEPMLKTIQTRKYNTYPIYSITLSWL